MVDDYDILGGVVVVVDDDYVGTNPGQFHAEAFCCVSIVWFPFAKSAHTHKHTMLAMLLVNTNGTRIVPKRLKDVICTTARIIPFPTQRLFGFIRHS